MPSPNYAPAPGPSSGFCRIEFFDSAGLNGVAAAKPAKTRSGIRFQYRLDTQTSAERADEFNRGVASRALLNQDGKLWIEHGGERYLLRRTANDRLILTK
mgnify:CR=1 FL=1